MGPGRLLRRVAYFLALLGLGDASIAAWSAASPPKVDAAFRVPFGGVHMMGLIVARMREARRDGTHRPVIAFLGDSTLYGGSHINEKSPNLPLAFQALLGQRARVFNLSAFGMDHAELALLAEAAAPHADALVLDLNPRLLVAAPRLRPSYPDLALELGVSFGPEDEAHLDWGPVGRASRGELALQSRLRPAWTAMREVDALRLRLFGMLPGQFAFQRFQAWARPGAAARQLPMAQLPPAELKAQLSSYRREYSGLAPLQPESASRHFLARLVASCRATRLLVYAVPLSRRLASRHAFLSLPRYEEAMRSVEPLLQARHVRFLDYNALAAKGSEAGRFDFPEPEKWYTSPEHLKPEGDARLASRLWEDAGDFLLPPAPGAQP